MTTILITVIALGWLLASTIGTWAYFANDRPKANKSNTEPSKN